jgi:hypothetical protein
VADVEHTGEEKCFVADWQPSYFTPRHLLPFTEVVEIVLDTYRTQQPSKRVKWET